MVHVRLSHRYVWWASSEMPTTGKFKNSGVINGAYLWMERRVVVIVIVNGGGRGPTFAFHNVIH